MSRRQSRNKATTSYRVEEDYSFLDEEDESAGPSRPRNPRAQDDDEDGDDFMPDANAEEPEDDEFDEDVVEEEESEDGAASDEEVFVRESSIVIVDEAKSTPLRPSKGKGKSKPAAQVLPQIPPAKAVVPVQVPHSFAKSGGRKVNMDDDKIRSRGIADFSGKGGQEVRLRDLFGPAHIDLKPILRTRDEWRLQETLPLRDSGLKRSPFESMKARADEARAVKAWYTKIGREEFLKGQKTTVLSQEEAKMYMLHDDADSINVLMGKTSSPQVQPLKRNSYVNIADPFEDKAQRRGWLLNLGARIQDAHWMTNEQGSTQYLAVVVEQKDAPDQQPPPMEQPTAPAFSALKPFPASIQIWAFGSTEDHTLDSSVKPRLALVICADWGAAKQLRWSPVSPHDRKVPLDGRESVDVGLLAGRWSDGRVRVLNIEIPECNTEDAEPVFIHISHAAFEVSIPQTVASCLQWFSATTFAVGTAAGTLAVWTLTRPGTLSSASSNDYSPKPWLYKKIGDTYVLTLISGWPSQPNFLSVTTADGFARIYDIRHIEAETVASVRGRVLVVTQAWHEHTQSFIMPDEYYILKHNNIRRFYHNIYSARAESSIVRVASSPVHPGVLIGTASGAVFGTNPVGRVVNTKVVPWQQNWFMHEWRPPVEKMVFKPSVQGAGTQDDGAQGAQTSTVPPSALSQPMVRITEGYKPTQPGIAYSTTSKKKPENETSTLITIFEEQSSISALAWNPNLRFGTWAAAGMNSGLLRVEDIGV
jgi:transcription factor C subunit 6